MTRKILFVCLGNICRSPIAEGVFLHLVRERDLEEDYTADSAGIGNWHLGEPPDRRAAATLTAAGYDPSRHRAQQYDDADADSFDLVLAMDHDNLADLGGRSERVGMFRDLDPVDPGGDVPDPYYGGPDGFAEVLALVERTSDALVDALADLLDDRP